MWAGPTMPPSAANRGTRPNSKIELFKRGEGYKSQIGILTLVL